MCSGIQPRVPRYIFTTRSYLESVLRLCVAIFGGAIEEGIDPFEVIDRDLSRGLVNEEGAAEARLAVVYICPEFHPPDP